MSVIERLSEDKELQDDFRLLGGVPLLLALLRYKIDTYVQTAWQFVRRLVTTDYLVLPCVVGTNTLSCSKSVESSSSQDKVTALKSATCSAITQLASHDANSLHFAQVLGTQF